MGETDVLNWHAWHLNYNSKIGEFCNADAKNCFLLLFWQRIPGKTVKDLSIILPRLFLSQAYSFPRVPRNTINISPQLLDMLCVGRLKWIPVFRVIPVPVCEWAHARLWATHTLLLESEPLRSNFFSSHKTVFPIVALLRAPFQVYFQKSAQFIYLQSFHTSCLPASTVPQLALTVVYMPYSLKSPQNTENNLMFYK